MMTSSFGWFRLSVLVGFLLTSFYAWPGIYKAISVAEYLGASPPTEPVWPAFGFLLTMLVMSFSIPVAINPVRYQANAVLVILGRFAVFFFWWWLYPKQTGDLVPWVAWMELGIGVVQLLFYTMATRDAVSDPSL